MTTREALLAAVAADPDGDTPRLVYADFLDETGDPADAARADLIRTQIAADRLPAGDPERARLGEQAEDLWEGYKTTWFDGVSPDKLPHPSRGFITHWGCYSADDVAGMPWAFAREPIAELTLSVKDPAALAAAADRPELARVRELKVWPGTAADAVLVPFFSSSHLSGLRSLGIMGRRAGVWGAMPEAARVLATRPQYAGLRELSIQHAVLGNAGARALARSTTIPTDITSLFLGQAPLTAKTVAALRARYPAATLSL